jgi:hypothetical protein
LLAGRRLDLVDAEGNPAPGVVLGEAIGEGKFHQVFDVPGNPNLVARIARSSEPTIGGQLDEFGRGALGEIDSDAVRAATREGSFRIASGPDAGKRVELIERIPEIATDQIARNAGRTPTPGQAIALDKAMRDLNAKGYAWLDNHHRNYAFERIGETGDDWRVVVADTGGIVKMDDAAPGGAAARARAVQQDLARPRPDDLALVEAGEARGIPQMRDAVAGDIRKGILERHGEYFDMDGMLGRAPDGGSHPPDLVPFRGDGTLRQPKVGELSQIDDPAELAARARLLRDDPLAASDLPTARLDDVRQTIRDRGYEAIADLPPKEAAAVRRAAGRVADKIKRGGRGALIEATVAVNGVRGDFAKVETALRELGLTPEQFAEMAVAGSDALTSQAVRASLVRADAAAIAAGARQPRVELLLGDLPK